MLLQWKYGTFYCWEREREISPPKNSRQDLLNASQVLIPLSHRCLWLRSRRYIIYRPQLNPADSLSLVEIPCGIFLGLISHSLSNNLTYTSIYCVAHSNYYPFVIWNFSLHVIEKQHLQQDGWDLGTINWSQAWPVHNPYLNMYKLLCFLQLLLPNCAWIWHWTTPTADVWRAIFPS